MNHHCNDVRRLVFLTACAVAFATVGCSRPRYSCVGDTSRTYVEFCTDGASHQDVLLQCATALKEPCHCEQVGSCKL